jgi:hypothetical protein
VTSLSALSGDFLGVTWKEYESYASLVAGQRPEPLCPEEEASAKYRRDLATDLQVYTQQAKSVLCQPDLAILRLGH